MDPGTDVDNVLKSLGQLGRYQKIQLSLLFIFMVENAFHLMAAVYISHRPEYSCKNISVTTFLEEQNLPRNLTEIDVSHGKCKVDIDVNVTNDVYHYQESCPNGYTYNIPIDRSTVTEWNLVCDGAARSEVAQTMIMAGQGIGAAIFSPLADRFGRKPANVASRILYTIAGITAMFSPSIAVFSLFRLLIGIFQGGSVCTITTLTIEILPKELRHRGEGIGFSAWTTGIIFTSILSYFCRDLPWRYLQLVLGLLSWHVLFDWMFLDESLRWLIANGKIKSAENIIRKAARMNKKQYENIKKSIEKESLFLPTEIDIQLPSKETVLNEKNEVHIQKEAQSEENAKKVHRYSALTLFRHKTILIMSLLLWFVWVTNTFTYYHGLMLTTSKLAGDRYVNNILASLSEIPAIIVQQLLLNRIGRRYLLILFHGISGTTLILATLCTTYANSYIWLPRLATIFSMIGRSSSIGSFRSVFLYTPELYATNLRNVGLGMASTVARIGSMISPFSNILAEYVLWGPAAIFALMNVIATCILLTLPETMGRELPTTIQEMKSWRKRRKGLFDMRMPKTYINDLA